MFELFKDPKVDFMGKRRLWLSISGALVLASLVVIPTFGIKRGIELSGGAELQIRYAAEPDLGAIRASLSRVGFDSNLVTTIGPPRDHEIYIRIGLTGASGEDITPKVVDALRTEEMREKTAAGMVNLNTADSSRLVELFRTSPDLTREEADSSAAAIAEFRKERAIIRSVDELAGVPGIAPPAQELLRAKAFAGPFAVRGQSYIGPAIGSELARKAVYAILGSLAGMLGYIWIRFQFEWGVAAVIALVHDTLITLGLFTLVGFEMSLPVVASFLTLVGYSVNDKVVVFDRMRENLRTKGRTDLQSLINDSMNQALSRTLLTSTLTWLATIALFVLGGPALRDFSFPLMVGIVVGTYSSIYTAAPILLIWQHYFGSRKKFRPAKSEAAQRPPARKVRTQ